MRSKNVKWLYGELPDLIEKGVLNSDTAEQVRQYYGEVDEKNWLQIALAIFGTLGAALIGAGIILLLAKNWSELSRFTRTILSLTPMIIGQLLTGWILYKGKTSIAWREGVSTFLMLSLGAAISLVGQTYHIPGNMASFLLTWMLLSLPLVYILDANVPAVMYLIGFTAWAGFSQAEGGHAVMFWIFVGLLVPYIWRTFSKGISSNRSMFLCWTIALTFCASIGITLEKVLPGLWTVIYASYFTILYLVGELWFKDMSTFWTSPFKVIGRGGILILTIFFTYQWPWRSIGWSYYRNSFQYHMWAGVMDYLIVIILFIGVVYLSYLSLKVKKENLIYSAAPILVLLAYVAISSGTEMSIIVILFNIYLLTVGIKTIVNGIQNKQMGTTNAGMLIVALLIVLRFFDADWGFVVRGVAFIMIGIGFLFTNYLVWNRKKGEIQ